MMDAAAQILPANSLGGFSLRKKISDYSELLERYNILEKLRYEQLDIYSTRYSFVGFPVEINVDTRTGQIYKISAVEGYLGKLNDLIGIGSSANDVLKSGHGFYYDDCDEAILSKEIEGVAIELNEDDPLPDEVASLSVESISIFDPEVFKPH